MRILIKSSLGSNGVAQVTMNYCMELRHENQYFYLVSDDPSTTKTDFADLCRDNKWDIRYICSPVRHPFQYYHSVRHAIEDCTPELFHINGNSSLMVWDAIAALREHIPVVVHCHNSNNKYRLLHRILKPILKKIQCIRIACSEKAGSWAYGDSQYMILKNAVDYDKFIYKAESREAIRKKHGISKEDFVILQVGNFNKEKNHQFTILLLKKIHCKYPYVKLLLCGDGPLRNCLMEQTRELGIADSVIFAGTQGNIEEYYSAGDILVQPSVFEGLPLTVVEAQAASLYCFVSSTITRECQISSKIKFLSIDNMDEWEKEIESFLNDNRYNTDRNMKIDLAEMFNIHTQAKILQSIYDECTKRNEKE